MTVYFNFTEDWKNMKKKLINQTENNIFTNFDYINILPQKISYYLKYPEKCPITLQELKIIYIIELTNLLVNYVERSNEKQKYKEDEYLDATEFKLMRDEIIVELFHEIYYDHNSFQKIDSYFKDLYEKQNRISV